MAEWAKSPPRRQSNPNEKPAADNPEAEFEHGIRNLGLGGQSQL